MEIKRIDFASPTAGHDLHQSFVETGFAVITNHPVSHWVITEAYADWKAFFASETKHDYLFKKDSHSGYFPFKSENAKGYSTKDLKEFFHVYGANQVPAGLGNSTAVLLEQLEGMGLELLAKLYSTFDAKLKQRTGPLPSFAYQSPNTLLRTLHYPPVLNPEEEVAVRAAAHEDINLLTLLPVATAPGLEVKGKDGKWYQVGGNQNEIIVNAGDMLQAASDGYFKSTTHRVVNPVGEAAKLSRHSIALFLHAHPDAVLAPDLTAGQYLHQRLTELGLK